MRYYNQYKKNRMTTVKVNTKDSELLDFTRKIMYGIDISFKKLVKQRSLEDKTLCFSDEKGCIYTVDAKEVEKMYM